MTKDGVPFNCPFDFCNVCSKSCLYIRRVDLFCDDEVTVQHKEVYCANEELCKYVVKLANRKMDKK